MIGRTSTFPRIDLSAVARISAILLALACGDTISPPVATKYEITISSSNAIAGSQVVLVAQLVDKDGRLLAIGGRVITWSEAVMGKGAFLYLQTTTASDGSATTMFTTSRTADIVHRIRAIDGSGIEGFANVTTVAGPAAKYTVGITGAPVAGSSVPVFAQLADENGNTVTGAGRVVTWSSTGAGGSFSSPTSTTNANGVALVTFTTGTSAYVPYTVTATDAQSATGVSNVFFATAGQVTTYVVSTSVIDPPAGADIVIYARTADAYGNAAAVSGRVVTWTKTGSGGSFSSPTAITDENGTATVTFTTSNVAGTTYAIKATDGQGMNGTSHNITSQPQVSLTSIATGIGAQSSCGIASDGKAWCWGANDIGGLGNGTTVDRSLPGRVSGNLAMTSLSVGFSHACGVTTSGVVQCWGNNTSGQLGDNTATSRSLPAPIASSLTFTSVTAGTAHTCALATNGDAYCWGPISNGRLGDGGQATSGLTPVKVAGAHVFASISAGDNHTCAVTTSGDAYCWGSNEFGKLGDNSVTDRSTPVAVAGGYKFTAVSAAEYHTCGIVANGAAVCWGGDQYGQLGDGTPLAQKHSPTAVAGGLAFVAVSAGGIHTCGITTSSAAWCWGDNSAGELGGAFGDISASPTAVGGGLLFKSIGAGGGIVGSDYYYSYPLYAGHTCAVTTTNVAYCWGSNNRGELGAGLGFWVSPPRKVSGQP
jgi:alpha-tubulin suppressor-like RCC1 family protein